MGLMPLCYLCGTNEEMIYPSLVDESYDPKVQTIASSGYAIPLLWLSIFAEKEIHFDTMEVRGCSRPVYATFTSTKEAIARLDFVGAVLNRVFDDVGNFTPWTEVMRKRLEAASFSYLTLELEEIQALYPTAHRFPELLRLGLHGFHHPDDVTISCESGPIPDYQENRMMAARAAQGQNQVNEDLPEGHLPGFSFSTHREVLTKLSGLNVDSGLPAPDQLRAEGTFVTGLWDAAEARNVGCVIGDGWRYPILQSPMY